MARPALHSTDAILDAAHSLALDAGTSATTINEIARVSGAPVGSLYHRFGSRDDLLAQMWMRSVRRSQVPFIAALDNPDPTEAAIAGAMAILDFCAEHRADARLLQSFRWEDLLRAKPSRQVAEELEHLNRPLERALRRLARSLYGTAGQQETGRLLLVTFDIPYGAARRHLVADQPIPATLRADIERAVRAVLTQQDEQRPT